MGVAALAWLRRRRYALALAGILALAAFLRLYRLDTLPLGFHHDEALDAISASRIWRGDHPIFFTNTNPREPLMIYLQSLGVLLFGATRLGARVMPAVVGIAGVAAAYFVAREMFGRRVGLLAAGFTAISFWQMFESRISARAISQPLVETICLLFFWRCLKTRRWPDTVLAGVFLGLVLYTYTAARAVPILLVLVVLWQLLAAPRFFQRYWSRMLAVAGIGVIVFLPLGLYFLRHPEDFLGRSLEVNVVSPQPFTGAAHAGGVAVSVLNTLGMFSIRGDAAWKYNLGGQPVFDWPMSALFYAGILLALSGVASYLRQPRYKRAEHSAHAFTLLWLGTMLLPGFLSGEAPHFLRTIGVIPAVFLLPALTLDWLIQRWAVFVPLAGLLIAGEAGQSYYRYFEQWAHNPEAYYQQHGDVADIASYLRSVPRDVPILFSTEYPGHPTVLYLAPQAFGQIRWFDGRQSLAFPPAGKRYLYVFPTHYQPGFADLSTYFRPDQLLKEGRDPEGGIAYRIYSSEGPPPAAKPPRALIANLGGLIALQGVATPGDVQAGQTLQIQEYWKVLKQGPQGLRAYVHLVDGRGHLWAQADSLGFYAEDWRPEDTAINEHSLDIPSTAPPVPMKLVFGLYSPRTGQHISLLDQNGSPAGTELTLGTVQVRPATSRPDLRSLPHAMDRPVAPGLTLRGYALDQSTVQAGSTLPVTLYWQVTGPLSGVPALQLSDMAARDSGLSAELPPDQWPVGVIQDRHDVTIPPTARAGNTVVELGGMQLGPVSITEPQRTFTLPPLQHTVGLPVGNFATLAGYDLGALAPGRPLQLTLVWQSRTSTPASYKVFTHMLDGENHVVAQRDDFPAGGGMPTTFWVPGQVIVDSYQIPLPATLPSTLRLEVGMYDPATGKRVAMGTEDRLLLPLS